MRPWHALSRSAARRFAGGLGLAGLLSVAGVAAQGPTPPEGPQVQQVMVGPNVNMVGGPTSYDPATGLVTLPLIGDPFLTRQNEPSLAKSARNPCHLLAGANDYRAVDLEQLLTSNPETGDAWLGLYKSLNCGATWTSALWFGHPGDNTPEGLASPIRGLTAAADPVVRAGTSGMFYMAGLAFDRDIDWKSSIFVGRLIDNNNADGADPIKYIDTKVIASGRPATGHTSWHGDDDDHRYCNAPAEFLDKPWIATDLPRGAATCSVDGQTFPAGPVYLTYTIFVGDRQTGETRIMFAKSTDCGATWSDPKKLNKSYFLTSFKKNQGTSIAVDPGTGHVYVVWRDFTDGRDAIVFVRSTDGGASFSSPRRIEPNGYRMQPFDQASTFATFRTNAYPTIAIVPAEAEGRPANAPGRVYAAWAARGFVAPGPDQGGLAGVPPGDARIVYSTYVYGQQDWSDPVMADPVAGGDGHQVMPTLAFSGGKLALAYYDLREDRFGASEDLVFEGGLSNYLSCLEQQNTGTLVGTVVQCLQELALNLSRHTIDLRAAMVDAACLAAGDCSFSSASVFSTRVSRYASRAGVRLQHNPPNLPLFSKGRYPFIGDYIDIAGPMYTTDAQGGWTWNRDTPVFHVSWTDNRDVRRPSNGDWEDFTARTAEVCDPGQAGIRNQNVYTAQLRPGLVVSAPINAKRISGFQRTFVVVVQNTTDEDRQYQLCLPGTACSETPAIPGVTASFNQYTLAEAPITALTITIARRSTSSRTVFVQAEGSAPADVKVPVRVTDLGGATAPSAGFDTVFLNPDFDNPDFDNPDFDNTELHNPDFDNPDFDNPVVTTFSFLNPDFDNPDFDNQNFRNPDFDNPDFDNPDFDNPDFDNPDFDNPDFDNPDFDNPDFDNPDFDNPDFDNPDFDNATIADVTWKYTNPEGNQTSAFSTQATLNLPACTYVLRPGDLVGSEAGAVCGADGNLLDTSGFPSSCAQVSCVGVQLVARRLYESPSYKLDSLNACVPDAKTIQNQALTNIYRYDPTSGAATGDRNDATFYLGPGESGYVTLRLYGKMGPQFFNDLLGGTGAVRNVTLEVEPQAADCRVCVGAECTGGDQVGETTECVEPEQLVFDTIPPVLSQTDTIPAFEASGPDGVANTIASYFTADDETDGPVLVVCGGDSIPIGTSTVTCSATDSAGNAAMTDVTVTVLDTTPPTFDATQTIVFTPELPAEATGPGGAVVSYTTPAASDWSPVSVSCTPASGSTFPVGETEVDCTATDDGGNATTVESFLVVVVGDTSAPLVTVPDAPTAAVEGNAPGGAVVTFTASAADVVEGSLAATCAPASGSTFPIGTTTVTCSATDASGNEGSTGFPVTVVDTTAPVVTLTGPAALTIEAGSAFSDPGATSADVVWGAPPVTIAGSVDTLVPGEYALIYAATDGSGNTGTATRLVTVADTTAPVIAARGDEEVETTVPSGTIVAYAPPTWTDAVDGTGPASCAPAPGSTFPIGTTTVTCTATDAAGNVAIPTTFTVTVVLSDVTGPTISADVNPKTLWPPNGTTEPVTVFGTVSDAESGTVRIAWEVVDEYNQHEPTGSVDTADGPFSFQVPLIADRKGNDKNGRRYEIRLTAFDAAGNSTVLANALVVNIHDQGGK